MKEMTIGVRYIIVSLNRSWNSTLIGPNGGKLRKRADNAEHQLVCIIFTEKHPLPKCNCQACYKEIG